MNSKQKFILLLIVFSSTIISCGEENCECPIPEIIEYTNVIFYCKEHPDCVDDEYDLYVRLYANGEFIDSWFFGYGSADPNLEYPASLPFQVELNSTLEVYFDYENKSTTIDYERFNIVMDAKYCTYISFFAGISNPCFGDELCDSSIVYEIAERMKCEGADSLYIAWYGR